jgi:cobalamin biosynthesis Mg chelatase CobN
LEAIDRDVWNATDEMKEKLRGAYLEMEGKIEDDGSQDRLGHSSLWSTAWIYHVR